MSADDYGIVHRHGDGWAVTVGFASDDDPHNGPDKNRPDFTCQTRQEAESWASDAGFEYGWTLHADLRDRDEIQFARLIAEMDAACLFNFNQHGWNDFFESTDLDVENVLELIDRAQTAWDYHKDNHHG